MKIYIMVYSYCLIIITTVVIISIIQDKSEDTFGSNILSEETLVSSQKVCKIQWSHGVAQGKLAESQLFSNSIISMCTGAPSGNKVN